jgi:predicted O-methyltransferase YrrM
VRLHYWIRHPGQLFARIRYWWWEKRNPDKPWLTPGAVDFLESHVKSDMTALELGSGRSTLWYASKVGRLISVEHDAAWFERVKGQLAAADCRNVDYRFVPLDHPESEPERPEYHPLPAYVRTITECADNSLDFVVVDGHYRSSCIAAVLSKIKPGGLLLVDDANMWPDNVPPVPRDWPEVSRTTNGIKFTVIWRKPRGD